LRTDSAEPILNDAETAILLKTRREGVSDFLSVLRFSVAMSPFRRLDVLRSEAGQISAIEAKYANKGCEFAAADDVLRPSLASHLRALICNVPFGPNRRRLWVGKPREWKIRTQQGPGGTPTYT
jgi:hypothetical protein